MEFREYLARQTELVNMALDRLSPPEPEPPETIHRAMRYSLFAGGKRIRPALCLAAAEAITRDPDPSPDALGAACALEMIHTYSLIHDDLPALDNDDLRRGRPTNHKVFGEAIAILAGDALLTLAFQTLAQLQDVSRERRSLLVEELAMAAGTRGGMIGGQVHDIEGELQQPTEELLHRIHRAKTGALLRASVRLGAIVAGADDRAFSALSDYGEHAGLAFQIVDDLLDAEQSSEALGKTAGKDVEQHKITFPAVYGIEPSRAMARGELAAAHQALAPFGDDARRLHEIADFIIQRRS
jgi:geranylgeranyl diphosphate synthase type II